MDQTQVNDKNPKPVLQVHQVSKSYQKKNVLHDISLTLHQGELFGLIGLNGVGKTTLIKIILDLLKADAGAVQVHGVDSRHVSARRDIAYVPEKFQPSRYLTGKEFLHLSAAYYGKKLDMKRAEKLAESLALDPAALYRKVSSYSKGMGQKLGLLGACLTDQQVLILDEPMSGLDPKARIKLKELLLGLRAQGKTIFFSSHILADIDEICDRIAIIHDTRICYDGSPEGFKHEYDMQSLEKAFLKSIDMDELVDKAA